MQATRDEQEPRALIFITRWFKLRFPLLAFRLESGRYDLEISVLHSCPMRGQQNQATAMQEFTRAFHLNLISLKERSNSNSKDLHYSTHQLRPESAEPSYTLRFYESFKSLPSSGTFRHCSLLGLSPQPY